MKENIIQLYKINWPLVVSGWLCVVPAIVLLVGSVLMALHNVEGWGWVLVSGVFLFLFRGKVIRV